MKQTLLPGFKAMLSLYCLFNFAALCAQNTLSNPTCVGISQKECFMIHIREAEIMLEGTVLNSRKYIDSIDHRLKLITRYRVEKLFKGDLQAGTVTSMADEEALLQIFARWYELGQNEKLGESAGLAIYEPDYYHAAFGRYTWSGTGSRESRSYRN